MKNILVLFTLALLISSQPNAQDSTWFEDVTSQVGLSGVRGNCIYVADVNNDDYPDLITITGKSYTTNRKAMRLYLNLQHPDSTNPSARIFVDFTDSSGINANPDTSDTGRTVMVAVLADIDNDGDVDLITQTYYHRIDVTPDFGDRGEVLLNDGEGHFTIVPDNGIHDLGWLNTVALTCLDYDLDGNIDLYIATFFDDYTNDIFMKDYLEIGRASCRERV